MKVTCPRCGEPGYLTRVKVGGRYYMRMEHVENGKKRVCYLGRDTESLRQYIESGLGLDYGFKIMRFAGGDYKIASVLRPRLERLCPQPRCTFVEVFGGSGYMSQTVSRGLFYNIVYNDVDDRLTTLYRYVKERPEQLTMILGLMPYSRSFYRIVTDLIKTDRDLGSLAGAALIFYAYNTSIYGKIGRGFAYGTGPGKNEARAFRSRIVAILKFAEAWKDITIESLDFREVIKKYDGPKTVFYLDPPYPDHRSEDYYGIKFTMDDLRDMAQMLTQVQGRFLIKLDKDTYSKIRDILPPDRFRVEEFERKIQMYRARGAQKGVWTMVLVSKP